MTSIDYAREFYLDHREGARRSASVIVPIVVDLVRPTSVVDVGCGDGTWLAAFRANGVADVAGVDGTHVDPRLLQFPRDAFTAADLEQGFDLGRRFDLVVSLEVAEHLAPEAAPLFVESLVALGPVVLFSAAIPGQGGTHHVNEQWPPYWVRLFGNHGYTVVDAIRGHVWDDDRVEFWYAQNALLFVSSDRLRDDPTLTRAAERVRGQPLAVVHPKKYVELLEWCLNRIGGES